MKFTFCIFLMFLSFNMFGQELNDTSIIVSNEVFPLHTVAHSPNRDGNGSRKISTFNLPENTKKLYISFYATKSEADAQKAQAAFGLLGFVTKVIDISAVSSVAVKEVLKNSNTVDCDFYFLNSYEQQQLFLKHQPFNPFLQKTGIVSFENLCIENPLHLNGTQYIGIKNNNILESANINLQVVAVVEKTIKKNGWSKEIRQSYFSAYVKIISTELQSNSKKVPEEKINAFVSCIVDKLTEKYSFVDWKGKADYEVKNIITVIGKECGNAMK